MTTISNRLSLCCSMVQSGERVADIGCDHGYLGIHLLQAGKASFVYASDVNPMPLDSAKKNAELYDCAGSMTFYLSDGLDCVPHDFDCLVLAGMGADTMIEIIQKAPWLKHKRYHMVLQCQSKRPLLRKYLANSGFCIVREDLAKDGKFIYPVMDVVWKPSEIQHPADYYISPQLLSSGSFLLFDFLSRVVDGLEKSKAGYLHAGKDPDEELSLVLPRLYALKGECANADSIRK